MKRTVEPAPTPPPSPPPAGGSPGLRRELEPDIYGGTIEQLTASDFDEYDILDGECDDRPGG